MSDVIRQFYLILHNLSITNPIFVLDFFHKKFMLELGSLFYKHAIFFSLLATKKTQCDTYLPRAGQMALTEASYVDLLRQSTEAGPAIMSHKLQQLCHTSYNKGEECNQ